MFLLWNKNKIYQDSNQVDLWIFSIILLKQITHEIVCAIFSFLPFVVYDNKKSKKFVLDAHLFWNNR